ncbi:hypothetical protein [Undibacterium sp. WLX3042]|uniref:hypothetical protein n=1 Tax=Undibacterium sp. WLX3042 TaxID=3412686 RepID=UPI003C2F5B12
MNTDQNDNVLVQLSVRGEQKKTGDGNEMKRTRQKVTKKSLGGGLTQHSCNGMVVSYSFRKRYQGTDYDLPLGNVNELSEEQARVEADKLCKQIRREKSKNLLKKVTKNLAVPKMPCFKDYEDANKFIEELEQKFPIFSWKCFDIKKSRLEFEIYAVIWILLLMPFSLVELLTLKQNDLRMNRDERYSIQVSGRKNNSIYVNCSRSVSQIIYKAIHWDFPRNDESGKLFFALSSLGKMELNAALKSLWPAYAIDVNKFTKFFEFAANHFSCYRNDFIRDYVNKRQTKYPWRGNEDEREMLMNWWEYMVRHKCFTMRKKRG